MVKYAVSARDQRGLATKTCEGETMELILKIKEGYEEDVEYLALGLKDHKMVEDYEIVQ